MGTRVPTIFFGGKNKKNVYTPEDAEWPKEENKEVDEKEENGSLLGDPQYNCSYSKILIDMS